MHFSCFQARNTHEHLQSFVIVKMFFPFWVKYKSKHSYHHLVVNIFQFKKLCELKPECGICSAAVTHSLMSCHRIQQLWKFKNFLLYPNNVIRFLNKLWHRQDVQKMCDNECSGTKHCCVISLRSSKAWQCVNSNKISSMLQEGFRREGLGPLPSPCYDSSNSPTLSHSQHCSPVKHNTSSSSRLAGELPHSLESTLAKCQAKYCVYTWLTLLTAASTHCKIMTCYEFCKIGWWCQTDLWFNINHTLFLNLSPGTV